MIVLYGLGVLLGAAAALFAWLAASQWMLDHTEALLVLLALIVIGFASIIGAIVTYHGRGDPHVPLWSLILTGVPLLLFAGAVLSDD